MLIFVSIFLYKSNPFEVKINDIRQLMVKAWLETALVGISYYNNDITETKDNYTRYPTFYLDSWKLHGMAFLLMAGRGV